MENKDMAPGHIFEKHIQQALVMTMTMVMVMMMAPHTY